MSETPPIEQALATTVADVNDVLDQLLALNGDPEDRVVEAMRYAVLGGGKRLRPFLLVETAAMFGVSRQAALLAGAAVECVHAYSLIHDDLPAMDDDDLRHGQPTTHLQFDEATAILAGDALLTLAFEILASNAVHGDPAVRIELVSILAKAAGAHGMVGGQMIDLQAETLELDENTITRLQQLKTGALIAASCEMGAVLGHAAPKLRHAVHAFAHDLGLAFQITDDLLDEQGDEAAMGKRARKDAAAGKATFVSILGVDRARHQASVLTRQASEHLAPFAEKASNLHKIAAFLLDRRH